MPAPRRLGAILYPGFEMLDYCGPLEMFSVPGSALLAKAGLLDGRRATSNKQVFALATQQSDKVQWIEAARRVEDGKFFTSSGVSAGMDMALAIVEKLFGEDSANLTASYTEYIWHRDADKDPFAAELNVLAKRLGLI